MRYSPRQIDSQFRETADEQRARLRRPPMCDGCGINRSDPPSKLCPGCQAYREHQQ